MISSLLGATACDGAPLVRVANASYVRGGYRSFEFANVSACTGQLTVLLSGECAFARDLLLVVAGAVRPTSGSIAVGEASFTASAADATVGSLRAALAWCAFQRELRSAVAVGLGVFTGLTEVDAALTVEEAVTREFAYRRRACAEIPDSLDFLATFGLATHADQRIDRLHSAGRARLSAALALASSPRVAVVDLRDPFCAGLTAVEERAVVCDLRDVARATDTAILVSCSEASSSVGADAVFTLDIAAEETRASAQLVLEGMDA